MPPPILDDDGVTFGGLERSHPADPQDTESAIDPADMMRVLRGERAAMQACYARELAANPKSLSIGAISFTIEPDGRVTHITIGRASQALADCLGGVLAGLRFPPPRGGATVRVSYPMNHDSQGAPGVPPPDDAPAIEPPAGHEAPWTPFALAGPPPLAGATTAARVTEPLVRARLDQVAACFPAGAPTGSLRVMLGLNGLGDVLHVRAGGLGDAASLACVRAAFAGLHVATSGSAPFEVACDLSRGDAQRWRVDPADYEVIEATRTGAVHRGQRVDPAGSAPDPLPAHRAYLVLADPSAPGSVIELALAWASEGDGTLLALRDRAGAPMLVGAGRSSAALGAAYEDVGASALAFDLAPDRLVACVAGQRESAPLTEPKSVAVLLAKIAARCRAQPCTRSAGLAFGNGVTAAALADAVGALRRAGFERVLIGGGIGCRFEP